MSSAQILSDRWAAITASFLPKSLRQRYTSPTDLSSTAPYSDAALLWCDIANFTPLANRLVRSGPQGVEQLVTVLDQHFNPLLELVVAYGGEPLTFVGDALLAAWFCSADKLDGAVARAARCAELIRVNCRVLDDRNEPLELHLHVAAGTCQIIEVGDVNVHRLFVPIGTALHDLAIAASIRDCNHVVLSSAASAALAQGEMPDDAAIIPFPIDAKGAMRWVQLKPALLPISLSAPVQSTVLEPYALEALNQFLPLPVRNQLAANLLDWLAELRWVTIVFTKLTGPNPSAEPLNLAVQIAQPIITGYEGVLSQVIVDDKGVSILSIFGAPPYSHPENPSRGVRAAMELQQALTAAGLPNSLGVTTGRAFCGIIGSDIRRHYTVIGDVVNLAARLMVIADGVIHCDEATVRAARHLLTFAPCEPVGVKGYERAVNVYTPHITPVSVSRSRLPTVGRQEELNILTHGLETVRAGKNAMFILMGEHGIGKSRLLETFRSHAEALGTWVVVSQANYIERDAVYHVWRRVFSVLLGLDEIGSAEARRTAVIDAIGADRIEQASLLNAVLPLDLPDSPALRVLSGEQRATATRALLLDLVRSASRAETRVILFEDAHYFDDASWELVVQMARIPGLLVVMAMQPMLQPTVLDQLTAADAQILRLGGLEWNDLHTLLCSQLEVSTIPAELVDLVQQHGKGHPFFSLAIVQSLLNEGVISVQNDQCELASKVEVKLVHLPQDIQEAVTQQLDSLPPHLHLTLKVSSVVGMTFPTTLVQDVYPIADNRSSVIEHLSLHSCMGMIYPEQVQGEMGYAFSHGIIRNVAYNLMLFAQRRDLHRHIAEWYEAQHYEHSSHFLVLAYHWEQAEEFLKAVDYLEREALRVFSLGLAKQSVDVGLRAALLLGLVLPTDPAAIAPLIGQTMGWIGEKMGDCSPSDLLNLPVLKDAKVERSLWLLLQVGPFAFQSRQIELFALMAVTALRLTLEHGNGAPTADVYSMYSVVHRALTQDRIGAYRFSQLALDFDQQQNYTMRSRVAFVHTWFHNHWVHPLETSLPIALDAAERGLARGDILFGCFNLSGYVIYLAALGRPLEAVKQTARSHLEQNGRRVANSAFHLIHELQFAKALAGETHDPFSLTDDEFDEARDIAWVCNTELSNQIGYYLVSRLKLHVLFRDWSEAMAWANKAQQFLPAFQGQTAEIEFVQYRCLAALGLINSMPTVEVDALTQAAADVAVMQQWAAMCAANFEHKAALLQAELARVRGDSAVALESYAQAVALAKRAGFQQDLALALECCAFYHYDRGEVEMVQLIAQQAIDQYIAWGAKAKAISLAQMLQMTIPT